MKVIVFKDEQKYIDLFIHFPQTLYQDDKYYPGEHLEEITSILKNNYPLAKYLTKINLLVVNNNKVLGRAIAFISPQLKIGTVGYFECINNQLVANLIFDAACAFFRENKIKTIYGPMAGSIWLPYRLMISGFNEMPFYGEPYNKDYYLKLFANYGFKIDKEWVSYFAKRINPFQQPTELKKVLKSVSRYRKQTFKIVKVTEYEKGIKEVYPLVMNAFKNFYLFNEIDEETFMQLYAGNKALYDANLFRIAYYQGEPIGFVICVPDYFTLVPKKRVRYVALYLGVKQNKQGESLYPGVGRALMASIYKYAFFKRASLVGALISEDAKTYRYGDKYDNKHQYALLKKEIKN